MLGPLKCYVIYLALSSLFILAINESGHAEEEIALGKGISRKMACYSKKWAVQLVLAFQAAVGPDVAEPL